MGDGGGQTLLARDEHDPDAPLVRRRIVRTYERTAYHLQVLTLRDDAGHEQTLRVTDEHPFYRQASADAPGGWTPARSLAAGDAVLAEAGVLTVVANTGQAHPQGVKVYNLEVEQAHTYFVLAEHAPDGADAVWVHNAKLYEVGDAAQLRKDPMRGTEVSHAPQSRRLESEIADFNPANKVGNEVGIRLPVSEHELVSMAQNNRLRTPASARELLADDIRIMRTFTKAPPRALLQVIDLSRAKHFDAYRPLHRE